jgi:hypothetical protein
MFGYILTNFFRQNLFVYFLLGLQFAFNICKPDSLRFFMGGRVVKVFYCSHTDIRLLVSLSFDTLLSQMLVLFNHFTGVVAFPDGFELWLVLAQIRWISLASVCYLPVIAGGAFETALNCAPKILVLQ